MVIKDGEERDELRELESRVGEVGGGEEMGKLVDEVWLRMSLVYLIVVYRLNCFDS